MLPFSYTQRKRAARIRNRRLRKFLKIYNDYHLARVSPYRVPLQILIYKLFGSQSSTIADYTSSQLRISAEVACSRKSKHILLLYHYVICYFNLKKKIYIYYCPLCYYVYMYYQLASRRTLYILYISNAILLRINV